MASQKAWSVVTLQADVRAEHEERAVGEVQHPHDPERERETGGQQEQDESIRQPVQPRHQRLTHVSPHGLS